MTDLLHFDDEAMNAIHLCQKIAIKKLALGQLF
jgi:hypothetical protein